jgi:DNA-directed RNA polymerase specialized sigma24 family protein
METLVEELAESPLIAAYMAGKPYAWQDLVDKYQDGLKACIRSCLHRKGIKDENIVEEVLYNLWHDLWDEQGFAGFHPRKGNSLRTFLHGIVKMQELRWCRKWATEISHQQQLALLVQHAQEMAVDETWVWLALDDFLAQASPGIAAYIRDQLQPAEGSGSRDDKHRIALSSIHTQALPIGLLLLIW